MTSSAGSSGLMRVGSPPSACIAARIAARSTTAGTPVKSCSSTRAGMNAISLAGSAFGSQLASARMSASLTCLPSSLRSRFSSRMRSENGSRPGARPAFSSAESLWISNLRFPTSRVDLLPKLFAMDAFLASGAGDVERGFELLRTARSAKVDPCRHLAAAGVSLRACCVDSRSFRQSSCCCAESRVARPVAGSQEKCFSTHWKVS